MSNFGASFKKARESKGISLDQIAGETRISTRFLQAIEDEEFQALPGGIFNRGFIRSYAERVGLDPEQAVADYARLVDIARPSEALGTSGAEKQNGMDRHLYPIAIVGLVLLMGIYYIVSRDSGNVSLPVNQPASVVVSEQPIQPPAAPPAAPPAPQPSAAAEEPARPAPVDALTLDIEATATTWIKLRSDGKVVVPGEILEPGMTRRVTAQESINLIVGNAGGITLKINDQPMKPIGQNGQVREVTITPEKIKDFTG